MEVLVLTNIVKALESGRVVNLVAEQNGKL